MSVILTNEVRKNPIYVNWIPHFVRNDTYIDLFRSNEFFGLNTFPLRFGFFLMHILGSTIFERSKKYFLILFDTL